MSRFQWYSFSEALETDGSGYVPYGSSASSLIVATPLLAEAASNLYFAILRITPRGGSLAEIITNRRSRLNDLAITSTTFDKEWARRIRSCPPLPKDMPPAARSIYMPGTLTGTYEGMFVVSKQDGTVGEQSWTEAHNAHAPSDTERPSSPADCRRSFSYLGFRQHPHVQPYPSLDSSRACLYAFLSRKCPGPTSCG